ncbi:putative HTH domain protein [Caulobacter phage BL47]|nr:putative HTH domain protein [Caulobacter phage BL47]
MHSMTPIQLKAICQRAWANMWQSEVAEATQYNKAVISRIMSGTRVMSEALVARIRPAVLDKLESFADILKMPGMPEADSFETQAAADLIREAVLVARGDEQAVARAKRRYASQKAQEAKKAA